MKIKQFTLISLITIWTILIGMGFVWMTDYTFRPGLPANVLPKLPADFSQSSEKNLPRLVLFMHPKCPCSLATVGELEQLAAENPNQAEITVIFYKPAQESADWVKTDLWQRVGQIPFVKTVIMTEEEIEKFGVITSGQTLLYDAQGNLIFSGGITIGRGHEGRSVGRTAIENYLQNGTIEISETPVYGCLLTSTTIN